VGAFSEDGAGFYRGAAYAFERDQGGAGNWGEVKKLTASDAQDGDWFGGSVAVSGDTAVVGAIYEDGAGVDRGAAYVFERDQGGAGNWGEVKKLTASDAQDDDWFGWSVAVSKDTAVVGAYEEDGAGSDRGAAYLFERDQGGAGNWGEVKKLTASDAQDYDNAGFSVAISANTAVMGALYEDGAGFDRGAAYVFGPSLAVGGVAELPDLAGGRLEAGGSPGGGVGFATWGAGGIAAGVIALTGAAWYARRRWLKA
jgi:hypothetical protein